MTKLRSPVTYEFDDDTIAGLFGHEAAERETVERLTAYYIRRVEYDSIRSAQPLRIIVGNKGVGKSAALKVACAEDTKAGLPTIWVRPDDVTEIYGDLLKEDNFSKLITLWKKGLARLVASRIAQDFMLVSSNDARQAVEWAQESGYRSKDLIATIAEMVKPLSKSFVATEAGRAQAQGEHHVLTRLTKDKQIRVYIDDLDRGWQGTEGDKFRMIALINALGDMTSDIPGLRVRMALRRDVYFLIRKTEQSMDKFEGDIVLSSWKNHDILVALAKRILTFFNKSANDEELKKMKQWEVARLLSPVFSMRFENTSSWEEVPTYKVLMSLVRQRPRDMVKLCTLAARRAHQEGSKQITGNHILSILEEYSQGRLDDTIIEFKAELPSIEALLLGMGPTTKELNERESSRYVFTTEQMHNKIKQVRQSVSVEFPGNKNPSDRDVHRFLYKIGFITARKDLDDEVIERYFYDEKRKLLEGKTDQGFSWEIHPAFRGVLHRKRKADEHWHNSVELSKNEN